MVGGGVRIDPAKFHDAFAADLPAEQAAVLAATQRPVAEAAFSEASGPPAWKRLPSWAAVASADTAAGTDVILSMAERAGATITELEGSHVIMISQPEAVTDVILKALAEVGWELNSVPPAVRSHSRPSPSPWGGVRANEDWVTKLLKDAQPGVPSREPHDEEARRDDRVVRVGGGSAPELPRSEHRVPHERPRQPSPRAAGPSGAERRPGQDRGTPGSITRRSSSGRWTSCSTRYETPEGPRDRAALLPGPRADDVVLLRRSQRIVEIIDKLDSR